MFKYVLYVTIFVITTNLQALEISKLAKELNLYAGTKATVQWKRIFSSQRRIEKYKINLLDKETRDALKKYLINHAADSEQPIVPGL